MVTEIKAKDKGTLDFLEYHAGWCWAGWKVGDRVVEREITRDEFARLHEEHADELVAGPADLPVHGYWAYAPGGRNPEHVEQMAQDGREAEWEETRDAFLADHRGL